MLLSCNKPSEAFQISVNPSKTPQKTSSLEHPDISDVDLFRDARRIIYPIVRHLPGRSRSATTSRTPADRQSHIARSMSPVAISSILNLDTVPVDTIRATSVAAVAARGCGLLKNSNSGLEIVFNEGVIALRSEPVAEPQELRLIDLY